MWPFVAVKVKTENGKKTEFPPSHAWRTERKKYLLISFVSFVLVFSKCGVNGFVFPFDF